MFDADALTARRNAAPRRVTCATSSRSQRQACGGIIMTLSVGRQPAYFPQDGEEQSLDATAALNIGFNKDCDDSQDAKGHLEKMRHNCNLSF